MSQKSKRYVLVLGGSNFMGRTLVDQLARTEDVSLTVINRGKSHWGFDLRTELQEGRFSHYYGDRDVHVEYGKLLSYLSKKMGKQTGLDGSFKWDLVIDFCGYLRKEVKSVVRGLKDRVKLYVFISTDSIYDVCDLDCLETPVKEENDVRPSDPKKLMARAEEEDYGHDKLKCEEYLRSHCSDLKYGIPFICLRLPDVIGPYDSTGRFWTYMLWIHKMQEWPINTKKESESKPLSMVYSEDVCNLIVSLLPKVDSSSFIESVHSLSFNLAFEETPTLNSFVQQIAACMQAGRVNFIKETNLEGGKGKFFYPSVYCPHLNIERAKKLLEWKPSTLEDAIYKTTVFFANVSPKVPEMTKVLSKLGKIEDMYQKAQ